MIGRLISGPILPTTLPSAIFDRDEAEQGGERGLEVVEAVDQVGDEEEQRPRPSSANALAAKTMNVSLVIARIAGTESIAKITSTIAIAASAARPADGRRARTLRTNCPRPRGRGGA